MALFISYSSQDRATVDALTSALRRGQQQVWFDQELGGGESWWHKICEQIRACEVFVVALSGNWLQSKPSQAELRYAQALNRPILPVRIGPVDSMRVNPLAALQIIDYQEPTVDAGIQLVTAVHTLTTKPVPLPDPLPDEPPVPFGYLTRLGNTLAEKEISPQQQIQLLVELRSGYEEDGDDPSARSDIAQLLRMLRLRHDVTFRTRSEIDNVLAAIEARDSPDTQTKRKAEPVSAVAAPLQSASARTETVPTAADPAGASRKRLMVYGGAAVAVLAAIAVAVVVMTGGGKNKPVASPAGTAGANRLDALLLSPAEIGTIYGNPTMADAGDRVTQPRAEGKLSDPNCLGAYEPIADAAYADAHGFTGVRGQAVAPQQDRGNWTFQAVSSFSSADQARAFVQTSAEKWRTCAGKTVTMTTNADKKFEFTFGPRLDGEIPKIWIERTEAGGTGRVCHHVLNAVSDVVIDVVACAAQGVSSPAGKITDKIAEKVAK